MALIAYKMLLKAKEEGLYVDTDLTNLTIETLTQSSLITEAFELLQIIHDKVILILLRIIIIFININTIGIW